MTSKTHRQRRVRLVRTDMPPTMRKDAVSACKVVAERHNASNWIDGDLAADIAAIFTQRVSRSFCHTD